MNHDQSFLQAERQAELLGNELQMNALPISPVTIARGRDIVVRPKDTDEPGVSGFLVRAGNCFGIQYASHIKSKGFIHFTVAHELGHYFLPGHPEYLFPHGDGTHASKSGFISGDPHEREADHFAAGLLMPEGLFRAALRKAGTGFEAIELLASMCQTSITATAIRFARFAEDPVAVLVSRGQKIEYFFLSDVLRDIRELQWPPKGAFVPRDTATAKFNRDPANVAECRRAEGRTVLDDWFDGAPSLDMDEDVVGLGSYARTLTVLFTDQPIAGEDGQPCYDDDG